MIQPNTITEDTGAPKLGVTTSSPSADKKSGGIGDLSVSPSVFALIFTLSAEVIKLMVEIQKLLAKMQSESTEVQAKSAVAAADQTRSSAKEEASATSQSAWGGISGGIAGAVIGGGGAAYGSQLQKTRYTDAQQEMNSLSSWKQGIDQMPAAQPHMGANVAGIEDAPGLGNVNTSRTAFNAAEHQDALTAMTPEQRSAFRKEVDDGITRVQKDIDHIQSSRDQYGHGKTMFGQMAQGLASASGQAASANSQEQAGADRAEAQILEFSERFMGSQSQMAQKTSDTEKDVISSSLASLQGVADVNRA